LAEKIQRAGRHDRLYKPALGLHTRHSVDQSFWLTWFQQSIRRIRPSH